MVGEYARPIVDKNLRALVEVIRQDQIPIAITINITSLNAAIPTSDPGGTSRCFIGKHASTVVHVDAHCKGCALRGISLPIRPHDVEVAIVIYVHHGALVGVLRLHGESGARLLNELLSMRRGDD